MCTRTHASACARNKCSSRTRCRVYLVDEDRQKKKNIIEEEKKKKEILSLEISMNIIVLADVTLYI